MKEEDITPLVVVSVPFFGGILALGMIFFLLQRLKAAPDGTGFQIEISKKVSAGAVRFLKTEYYYLVPFVVVMAAFIIGVLEGQVSKTRTGLLTFFHLFSTCPFEYRATIIPS